MGGKMIKTEIKVNTLTSLRHYIMMSVLNKLIDDGFIPSIDEEAFGRLFTSFKALYDDSMHDTHRSENYELLRDYGYDGSKYEVVKAIFSSLRSLSIIDDVSNLDKAISAIKDYEIFTLMECDGGGEGGSEDCNSIIKVGERYFQCNYNYYSYEGFDYSYHKIFEVTPKTVEVVQYFAI
jgi:hypothetical protein